MPRLRRGRGTPGRNTGTLPTHPAYYQLQWAGNPNYAAATSNPVTVS